MNCKFLKYLLFNFFEIGFFNIKMNRKFNIQCFKYVINLIIYIFKSYIIKIKYQNVKIIELKEVILKCDVLLFILKQLCLF